MTRTRYKGEGRHTEGNNDWEPTGRLRVKYDAGSFWDIAYNFSMSFDDSEVSGKIGGSYKIDNHINVGWKPSKKFDITNTLGVEIEDEKDNCDDDTCEYYYNLVANYHFLPKFTLYANYDFSNVQYKYKGRESYYESEITLGLKYTF